jgi:hypothetical protein
MRPHRGRIGPPEAPQRPPKTSLTASFRPQRSRIGWESPCSSPAPPSGDGCKSTPEALPPEASSRDYWHSRNVWVRSEVAIAGTNPVGRNSRRQPGTQPVPRYARGPPGYARGPPGYARGGTILPRPGAVGGPSRGDLVGGGYARGGEGRLNYFEVKVILSTQVQKEPISKTSIKSTSWVGHFFGPYGPDTI